MVKSNAVTITVTGVPPTGQVSVSISQPAGPGTLPDWSLSGLTPNGLFSVSEYVDGALVEVFSYSANASGSDTRPFKTSAVSGQTIKLDVSDTSGASGSGSYVMT